MNENEMIEQELSKLMDAREEFLAFIDANVPKDKQGLALDFSNHPTLDAQSVYAHFYKLDYQARKLRGFIINKLALRS